MHILRQVQSHKATQTLVFASVTHVWLQLYCMTTENEPAKFMAHLYAAGYTLKLPGLKCYAICAGVQLAKMTPFRSYVVLVGSCITSVFAKAFGYDAFPMYVSVSPSALYFCQQCFCNLMLHSLAFSSGLALNAAIPGYFGSPVMTPRDVDFSSVVLLAAHD